MPFSAARQTRRYEQKREAILDAAARLFNEKGLRGATLSDVAQSVGLITTSVTYYYRRKEDLAAACLLRTTAALGALIDEAAREPSPQARLRRLLVLYFELLADIAEGRRTELINFYDIRALTGAHIEPVAEAFNDLFRKVRRLLRPNGGSNLSKLEQNARAHLVFSLTLWARTWAVRYDPDDYPRAAERMADILLNGLGAPGAHWDPPAPPEIEPPAEPAREAFLKAVTELLNDQGYHGASVEKISARLNVTKGSFYHHNETKDDLVAQCFRRSFEVIRAVQRAAERAGRDGWSRAAAAADALVRRQLGGHGPLLRYTALAAVPDAMRREVLADMGRLTERFAGVIADGIADGSVRPVDPTVAALLVAGQINAAAEFDRWVPDADADAAGELFVRPLFEGVFARE